MRSAALMLALLVSSVGFAGPPDAASPYEPQPATDPRRILTELVLGAIRPDPPIEPVKVMPIGDSITEGNPFHHTYRYYLSQAHPNLDFVGSKHGVFNGQPLDGNFDQDHQAYWAWTADQVAAEIAVYADVYTPDVALIHLGTNDIDRGQGIPTTISDIEDVIAHLRDANPAVKILLAQIIYCATNGCSQQDDFNDAIAALVPNISTTPSPVYLVTMDDIGPGDLYDSYHPDSGGSLKMMLNWESALIVAGVL